MLPGRHRLRDRADFTAAVRGRGARKAGGRLLVVHTARAPERTGLQPRFGFIVSKSVGTAVVRNRVKRRLRALAAAHLDGFPSGVDVVVRANPPAADAPFDTLGRALADQIAKAWPQ